MEVKTRAIVLQTIKYGDSQLIVDLFTEKLGNLSFIVRISKSSKAKVGRQLFQPLMILNVEFDYRSKVNLQKMKDVNISVPFVDIPYSPYKLSISMFLSELLAHATKGEQKGESLFRFLLESVSWLDQAKTGFSNFHIVFMIRLSAFLGFFPNIENGSDGEYFDLVDGCFVSMVPTHNRYLGADDSLKMLNLLRLNYQTMHLYTMSRLERNRCIEVLLVYYRIHVPDFPELKSFSVLKELFA